MEETGISRMIPSTGGEMIQTPEEENARFMQGDFGEPLPNEDHVKHIQTHMMLINDPSMPPQVKEKVVEHVQKHVRMMNDVITMQMMSGQPQMGKGQMPSQNLQGGFGGQRNASPVDEATSLIQ